MRTSPILDALFPGKRKQLLAALFTQPEREWYLSELAKHLQTQPSSLQREVNALSKAGIISQRREPGRRLYLGADRDSPVFPELKGLFDKTAGLIPILAQELESFGDRISLAFVYGSVARSEEHSASDIDLMIIGDVGLADMVPALRRAERTLGRPINPTLYSEDEFQEKSRRHDHFLQAVLRGSKRFVKGGADVLGEIAG